MTRLTAEMIATVVLAKGRRMFRRLPDAAHQDSVEATGIRSVAGEKANSERNAGWAVAFGVGADGGK